MSIQPSDEDILRFRQDTARRQVKELRSITYSSEEKIGHALAILHERHHEDDMIVITERIIEFLRILK